MKNLKNHGITLIALVITVIILLILAGVSIKFVGGDNGLLKRAKDAVELHQIQSAKEKLEMKLSDLQVDKLYNENKPLTLEDLIVLNKEKDMQIETTTTDENGNTIDEKVVIYEEEKKYVKVTVDKFLFKVDEDFKVEYLGKDNIKKEERDSDYEEEIKDEVEDEIITDDEVSIDEIINETDIETVPNGWIGIYTETDLRNIANNLEGKYILMNDIKCTKAWVPIGTGKNEFLGYLNGNGYSISNMKISGEKGYLGMFGKTGGKANIANLTLNYTISGMGNYIGGLVAFNKGNISNVYCAGTITATGSSYYVGGLVGYHRYYSKTTTKIEKVYTEGTINSSNYGRNVGGIVGYMQGYSSTYQDNTYIKDSYTSMEVNGKQWVAGIVGSMYYSNLKNVYTIGKITGTTQTGGVVARINKSADAENSYYAREICKQQSSALGEKKSLELLSHSSTYQYDFVNTWGINEGKSTAYLKKMVVPNSVTNVLDGYDAMLGAGTQANPYQIKTVKQLQSVATDLSSYYILMADLDLSSISNWEPIGNKTAKFTGNFNGNGYTISNMKINSTTDYKGLFGYVGEGGTITNLSMKDYAITGSGKYIGGLAGYLEGGDIAKISTQGNMTLNSTAQYIGGIVGYQTNGKKMQSIINRCYSEGNIKSSSGTSYGEYIGGIIGYITGSPTYVSKVTNCYSSVKISASRYIGGVVGYCYGANMQVNYSYALGAVTGSNVNFVGGLIGYTYTTATPIFPNSYWIAETTGTMRSARGVLKGISTLSRQKSYSGWNFNDIWDIDEGKSLAYLRGMEIPNVVYDSVKDYPIMEGEGTASNPYIITNEKQLNKVRYELDKYYKLGNDINLGSISNWEPIGNKTTKFTGNFNGNGYTISNMKINSTTDYKGLFGYVGEGGTITNLSIKNYAITGSGKYIGGLAGYLEGGDIVKISTQGNMTLNNTAQYIGGIVGEEKSTKNKQATITKCYSEGNIKSSSGTSYGIDVGGIVGYIEGNSTYDSNVTNCYSSVNIIASSSIGGLIGSAHDGYANINYSYAYGSLKGKSTSSAGGILGTKSSGNPKSVGCYWDIDTTGQSKSVVGSGLSTDKMKIQSNYSGWDFNKIWIMEENGYPKLR